MILSLLCVLALAAPPLPGSEDYTIPQLDAEPWRPALASGHFLATEEVRVDSPFTGRVDTRWAHHPLLYRESGEGGEVIGILDEAIAVDLSATWALGPLRVGAWAPVYVYTRSGIADVSSPALGDGRVQVLYALHEGESAGAGLRLAVGLPLGGSERVVGSGDVSGELAVVADADVGQVRLAGEVGWVARPGVDLTLVQTMRGGLDVRLGAAWRAWEHTALIAELLTGWDSGQSGWGAVPAEVLLGTTHRHPSGRCLRGGVSLGLTPAIGVPTFRLVLGIGHLPHEIADE